VEYIIQALNAKTSAISLLDISVGVKDRWISFFGKQFVMDLGYNCLF
jgi:hypothetical protein